MMLILSSWFVLNIITINSLTNDESVLSVTGFTATNVLERSLSSLLSSSSASMRDVRIGGRAVAVAGGSDVADILSQRRAPQHHHHHQRGSTTKGTTPRWKEGDRFLATTTTTTAIFMSSSMDDHGDLFAPDNEDVDEEEEVDVKDVEDGEEEDEEYYDDDDDHEMDMLNHLPGGVLSYPWTIPNSFEQFLNQCTIQSFLFLCKSMRDPQTVLWMEEFTRPNIRLRRGRRATGAVAATTTTTTPTRTTSKTAKDAASDVTGENSAKFYSKLLLYHGLAAMNTTIFPTWESYFETLLGQPRRTYWVESSQAHVPSYELDINPASLCSRMISVREQIAREFVRDLDVIASLGGYTLHAYYEELKRLREKEERTAVEDSMDVEDHHGERGSYDAAENMERNAMKLERPSLLFLEMDPSRGEDTDYKPSPLRKGNFDLLYLLTTQEAIHRVLNQFHDDPLLGGGGGGGSSTMKDPDTIPQNRPPPLDRYNYQFLRNFYTQRLTTHFFGAKRYGRADDILEELLTSNPATIQTSDTDMALVDPMSVAMRVLEERQEVAWEWQLKAQLVPDAHTHIRRLQFNLLMGSYTSTENVESQGYME